MTDYKPFLVIAIFASWFLLKQLFVYSNYRPAPINFKAIFHQPLAEGEAENNLAAVNVICQPECWLEIGDRRLPARLASDAMGQLRQLNLRFVDERRGLIGYDNAAAVGPEFYVLRFDKELIQSIPLDLNHARRLEFAGYYPETAQMLFNSSDGNQWLYSAVSPNLVRK